MVPVDEGWTAGAFFLQGFHHVFSRLELAFTLRFQRGQYKTIMVLFNVYKTFTFWRGLGEK